MLDAILLELAVLVVLLAVLRANRAAEVRAVDLDFAVLGQEKQMLGYPVHSLEKLAKAYGITLTFAKGNRTDMLASGQSEARA